MKRMVLSLSFLSILVALPVREAHAVVSSCVGEANGIACGGGCILAGVCVNQVCLPAALAPDGAACASENRCTTGDTCQAGVCIAGTGTLVCPSVGDCQVGICVPHIGCQLEWACGPLDGGTSDAGGGGETTSQPDMSPAHTPDVTGPTTGDKPPVRPEHPTKPNAAPPEEPVGEPALPLDPIAPTTPDMGSEPGIVQGSNLLSGCTVVGGDPGTAIPLGLALMWLRLRSWKRRTARDGETMDTDRITG